MFEIGRAQADVTGKMRAAWSRSAGLAKGETIANGAAAIKKPTLMENREVVVPPGRIICGGQVG